MFVKQECKCYFLFLPFCDLRRNMAPSQCRPFLFVDHNRFQTNAMPPRPDSSMDMYTSSLADDEEVKVTLRFQTKRCLCDQPPNFLVELVVKPEV